MARMGNKWIALCTTAIGIVYGAGYAVNNPPELLQEAAAKNAYANTAPEQELSAAAKNPQELPKEAKTVPEPTLSPPDPIKGVEQNTEETKKAQELQESHAGAVTSNGQETSSPLKNKPQIVSASPVPSHAAVQATQDEQQHTTSTPAVQQEVSTPAKSVPQVQKEPVKPAPASVQEAADSTQSAQQAANAPKQENHTSAQSTQSSQTTTAPAAPTTTATTASSGTAAAASHTNPPVTKAASPYKDGTYAGSGTNSFGTVEVSLTVKQGKISNVQITSCRTRYPRLYIQSLPDKVVEKQSARIDMVSGATRSSEDFIEAVKQALQQAQA